jgi:hypothetical protein
MQTLMTEKEFREKFPEYIKLKESLWKAKQEGKLTPDYTFYLLTSAISYLEEFEAKMFNDIWMKELNK